MRSLLLLLLASTSLLLSGCSSMESAKDSVHERWTARYEGRNKAFTADQKQAYAAAQYAAKQLGLRVTRGGANQGTLEAVSMLESDASLRGSRQIALKLRITREGEGVSVNLLFTEVVADDSSRASAMGMETPMKDSPLYELFFGHMAQYLSGKTGS
jgi:uncharacterized protein YceK